MKPIGWNTLFKLSLLAFTAVAAGACSSQGESSIETASSGRPAVAVEVAPAAEADIEESIEVVGSLEPKFSADIKSEFTAVVEEVYVTEWVRVRKGIALAKLDTREAEAALQAARAGLLQAEVSETRASRELDRAMRLREAGLVTQQSLDEARTALEASQAATTAARAQLQAAETRLAKAVLRAPFDGIVAYRGVNPGDRVENMGGEPLFRIVDNRLLELTVSVPSTALSSLRTGQPLEFSTDAIPGRTFRGKVQFINPSADPVSRSVKVVAHVPNEEETLRGGLFVKGRILTGAKRSVLQVPRASLVDWDPGQGLAAVFVVNGDTAEKRPIRTGSATPDAVEVTQGLQPGERVVTRGAFNLRSGDRVLVSSSPEAAPEP